MGISITAFLMFEGRANEAIALYSEVIPDAAIVSLERYGQNAEGPEGTIHQAMMKIAGQTVRFFDSPTEHDFKFTPSMSSFVECDEQEQFDRMIEGLGSEGKFLMPADDYGFSKRYAWLTDRFGVSWQISLV